MLFKIHFHPQLLGRRFQNQLLKHEREPLCQPRERRVQRKGLWVLPRPQQPMTSVGEKTEHCHSHFKTKPQLQQH